MQLRQLVLRVLGPSSYDEVDVVNRLTAKTVGVLVDVGAHHGHALAPFLRRGWTVHAFEPDPANRAILVNNHPGLAVDRRAVAEVDGQEVELFTSDESSGISTLSPFDPSHHASAKVTTVRLDTYLADHEVPNVDFLKTDVEGHDLPALRTFPWDLLKPSFVVCEFEDKKTLRLGYSAADLAEFLQSLGYAVLVSEWHPITGYGQQHRWKELRRYPTALDSDSWGNFIAVKPALLDRSERFARRAARRLWVRQRVDLVRGKRVP